MLGEMKVTKGIRQGCTGSPQFFVMVVMLIIDRVVGSRRGYRDDDFLCAGVVYADDELLLARSCEEAEDMIRLVVEVAGKCGLDINKGKSNFLVYNCRGGGICRELGE